MPSSEGPWIFIPTGVLIPVKAMSSRFSTGMVQVLLRPGNWSFSSRPQPAISEHNQQHGHERDGQHGRETDRKCLRPCQRLEHSSLLCFEEKNRKKRDNDNYERQEQRWPDLFRGTDENSATIYLVR